MGGGEERAAACRMKTACNDKQICNNDCVRVFFPRVRVQPVCPCLPGLSLDCTLQLCMESIGACFRDDRGE